MYNVWRTASPYHSAELCSYCIAGYNGNARQLALTLDYNNVDYVYNDSCPDSPWVKS